MFKWKHRTWRGKCSNKNVNKGIINKHASILPTSRGLWPFFWNVINENKQGVSYHVISNKIDSGKMLLQKHLIKKKVSMIGYYLSIFNDYPFDIYSSLQILYNIKKKKLINKGNVSSYNSLPNKKDFFVESTWYNKYNENIYFNV